MLEPRGELDLPLEPLGAERGGELRMEDLERDGAVVAEVLDQIDRGHAPAAELALERIAALQRLPERSERIGHRSRCNGWDCERYAGRGGRGSRRSPADVVAEAQPVAVQVLDVEVP